jgi:hypothetical protein
MLERFSAEVLAVLNRAGRWAAAEGAKAIDTSHIARALERPTAPSGQAVSLWTPDAKRALRRAFSLSSKRRASAVEVEDLLGAVGSTRPGSGSQEPGKAASARRDVTPDTQASAVSQDSEKRAARSTDDTPWRKEGAQVQGVTRLRQRGFRRLAPSLGIAALVTALAVMGSSLVSSSPKPPPRPKAASGDLNFQLKEKDTRPVKLEVFVLWAQTSHPTVVLVPHFHLKAGETVPWRVLATGPMKAAQMIAPQQELNRGISVFHNRGDTAFYGFAHYQTTDTATFFGEPSGPERVPFVGPALALRVPGPFIRFANGYAVVALPGIGEKSLGVSFIAGGTGESALSFGDSELGISVTMTHVLGRYQMTTITPSALSVEPFEWKGEGYVKVSATGVDPRHGDSAQQRNVYAGLLLGFALSLLLPLGTLTRGAVRATRKGKSPSEH